MARYQPPTTPNQAIAYEIGSPYTNPRYFQITLPVQKPYHNPLKQIHRYIPDIAVGTEHPSGTTEKVLHLATVNRKPSKDRKSISYTIEVHYAVYNID
jgi:hypothetical protein